MLKLKITRCAANGLWHADIHYRPFVHAVKLIWALKKKACEASHPISVTLKALPLLEKKKRHRQVTNYTYKLNAAWSILVGVMISNDDAFTGGNVKSRKITCVRSLSLTVTHCKQKRVTAAQNPPDLISGTTRFTGLRGIIASSKETKVKDRIGLLILDHLITKPSLTRGCKLWRSLNRTEMEHLNKSGMILFQAFGDQIYEF